MFKQLATNGVCECGCATKCKWNTDESGQCGKRGILSSSVTVCWRSGRASFVNHLSLFKLCMINLNK